MNGLKKIVNFYILSNIHVAIAGFCITEITLLKFGLQRHSASIFVFFSILLSYNFIRFYEMKTHKLKGLKNWFLTNKIGIIILYAISFFCLSYLMFFSDFNMKSLIVLLPFAFATFFYVMPLYKTKGMEISFRNFPGIKIFSIAISWAGISVLFPLYEAGFTIDKYIFLEFFQRICILIAYTIPFDIRDVNSDDISLKTLPQLFGIKKTKKIGYVMLVIFILLELLNHNLKIELLFATISIAIIIALFLKFSSPLKSRIYTSFWVESVPIFWLGFIYLFSNIV